MKKRSCNRFSIPGTTLYYKKKPGLFMKQSYPDIYYPVSDLSCGGARFLCNDRLKAGTSIIVKLVIPGFDESPELLSSVRWISRNREPSYPYQTGIAFNQYGTNRAENSLETLSVLKSLEQQAESKKD